jgi:hypothetical protein
MLRLYFFDVGKHRTALLNFCRLEIDFVERTLAIKKVAL